MRGVLSIMLVVLFMPVPGRATTEFARRTMLTCESCHSTGTKLNAFGQGFMLNGFKIPKLLPRGDAPFSVRGQMVYSGDPDPTGLPKAIVDEVDLLSAGNIGKNLNYNSEVYLLDGGRIGLARETWLEYRTRSTQRVPIDVRAGLLVLPLPSDPERFRETNAHYGVYDQTVGNNPFTLFDPHDALSITFGPETRGTSVALLAVGGHDPQSGLATASVDTMVVVRHAAPSGVASFYRYDGSRPLAARDRFWRQGVGVNLYRKRLWLDGVLQTGSDSNALGDGTVIGSSGGYLQARYQLGAHGFGIARYDGTNDTTGAFARTLTVGAGAVFANTFRLEIEDAIAHTPQTHHSFSIVLGFGFGTIHGSY